MNEKTMIQRYQEVVIPPFLEILEEVTEVVAIEEVEAVDIASQNQSIKSVANQTILFSHATIALIPC